MLGKLFKYDFVETGKTISLFALVCFAVSIVGTCAMRLNAFLDAGYHNALSDSISAILTILTILAFICVFSFYIVSVILILKRYYTNLYTDEGYLTFTLPVKESQILLAKFFSGYIWAIIAAIVSVICFGFLIIIGTAPNHSLYNAELIGGIKYTIRELVNLEEFGSILECVIYYALLMIFGFAYNLLTMYLAITIGSIVAKKHKILAAIGIYYGVNTVLGIAGSVFSIIQSMVFFGGMEYVEGNYLNFIRALMIGGIAMVIALGVVAFFANKALMKRKLNLS